MKAVRKYEMITQDVRLQQHVQLALHLVAVADADELLRERYWAIRRVEGEKVSLGVDAQKHSDVSVIGQSG